MEKTELWNDGRCSLPLAGPPPLYGPRAEVFVPAYPGTAAMDHDHQHHHVIDCRARMDGND